MSIDPHDIELTDEQRRVVAAAAEESQMPWEEVLREALRCFRSRSEKRLRKQAEQSLYGSLHRRGLIGCIDEGPADVSTNPAYLEGFGRE